MQRFASITKVHPEKLEEYKKLHANAWSGVLKQITACQIQNYSIFWKQMPDGDHLLFSYLEYTGDDWQADCDKMAADPETQRWWDVCTPCLEPVGDLPTGAAWAPMTSIFLHK